MNGEIVKLDVNIKSQSKLKKRKTNKSFAEYISEKIFLLCAFTSILCVLLITIFIFQKGIPAIFKIGIFDFLFGTEWIPSAEVFGIGAMILGTIYATIGAVIIGVPIGVMASIFMCEFAPKSIYKLMKPAVELLAGIPSVVYGFFGLVVIVPLVNNTFGGTGGGNSLLTACIILSIMILPTIISISNTALLSVPLRYKEGSYALGTSHVHTIFKVMLPAAKSGVFSGIVLGIGRAIGETMAVILVAGNAVIVPQIFDGGMTAPVSTMTAKIAMEMSYAFGLQQDALFGIGVVLFIFIMVLNVILHRLQHMKGE